MARALTLIGIVATLVVIMAFFHEVGRATCKAEERNASRGIPSR